MLKKCHTHLDSVHENYLAHFTFAAWFGLRLIGAGVASILHALCPAIFQSRTSSSLNKLYEEMQERLQKTGHHHHHG